MGDFPIIKNPYGILVGGFNPSEKDSSVGIIFFPYGKINYGPVILEGLEELDDVWVVHHLHDGLRGGSFKGTTMATMVKSWGNCTVKRAKRENSLVKPSNPGSVKMLVRCRN